MNILAVVDMMVDVQMMLLNREWLLVQKGRIVSPRKIDFPWRIFHIELVFQYITLHIFFLEFFGKTGLDIEK